MPEVRLIDANALKSVICRKCANGEIIDDEAEYMRGYKDGLESVIKEECKDVISNLCESMTETVKHVIPLFMKNLEIKADLDAARWITCSERLPDSKEDVLVWFEYFRYGEYGCLYQTYGIGNYNKNYDEWMVNHETGWDQLRVIAWMPMPNAYEPPESEKQNE